MSILRVVGVAWVILFIVAGCAAMKQQEPVKPDPVQGAFIQLMELRDHD